MARRALLIGINEYERINHLRGCGNDVSNLFSALSDFAGFTSGQVRSVAHDRATKSAIESRLAWLVDGAQPGDVLVLHFSGHGTQVRDRDGDELSDGLDEVLCPYDMDWDGAYITDDYLRDQLQVPPGVVLEVILDACHSGESSRQVGFPAPAPPPDDSSRRPRFAQPPVDIVVRHAGESLPVTRLFRSGSAAAPIALWSSCAELQTAADALIDGVFNGAFTYFFCKHLRESPSTTRAELLRRVRSSLALAGYSQVPELSAPASLKNVPAFRGS
jgi:metacaspase-1